MWGAKHAQFGNRKEFFRKEMGYSHGEMSSAAQNGNKLNQGKSAGDAGEERQEGTLLTSHWL